LLLVEADEFMEVSKNSSGVRNRIDRVRGVDAGLRGVVQWSNKEID
jgi:hypothetical protein